ncbi:SDR family oxidoreductase [Rhodococcus zopfii]
MTTVGVVTGAGRGMGYACAQRLSGTVDVLLLADRDAATVAAAAATLASSGAVEPMVLDITDGDALARLADRVSGLGTLRAVAHAAGISPTMAGWRQIFTVDLVATAMLADALRPLATAGTATVCFASMAASLAQPGLTPEVAAVLDDPLGDRFLDRIRDAVGPGIEHAGAAYALAKLGVQRFVRREAVRLGPLGARICSVSPGIIDTPQGRQEAENNPRMAQFVQQTPLGRTGRADEVAAVVAFALSTDAGFLSGADLLVDGGVCAAMST